jgi:hypothetical protein
MKTRDYVFWIALTLGSVALGHYLRLPGDDAAAPLVERPKASLWEKATYWAAVYRLGHHFAPRQRPAEFRELPDEVVNAPAVRTVGPDGEPLIAHGEGW